MIEFFVGQHTDHGFAANQSAFFILKDDHFQRMPRRNLLFGESLRDFDRAERSNITVEVSTFGHTVDVRSKKDWSQQRIASGSSADEISRSIDRSIQFRRAHQI